jgi:hypothetical protein
MDDIRQHLETFGLSPAASLAEIKQAYRELMMVWHPDRFPGNLRLQQLAEEKSKQINLAYQQLNSHWAKNGVGPKPRERASTNAAGTNQQREESSRTSSNSDYQRERPRQSRPADTKTERARRNKSNLHWIPTTTGVLIIAYASLSCCLFLFVVDGGFSPWKALSIVVLVGISFYSLIKAKSDHPRLTIWNYLRTFATTTLLVCVGIALLAAWLLKNTDDRRSNT